MRTFTITMADVAACPIQSLSPEHYAALEDGRIVCLCKAPPEDDVNAEMVMIAELMWPDRVELAKEHKGCSVELRNQEAWCVDHDLMVLPGPDAMTPENMAQVLAGATEARRRVVENESKWGWR